MTERRHEYDSDGNLIVADVLAAIDELGGIVTVLTVTAFAGACILMIALSFLHAPHWAITSAFIVYATLPYAALTYWAWYKPAIRLPNNIILRQASARRYAFWGWGLAIVGLLWQVLTLPTR